MMNDVSFLNLLQLTNSALPVGAYSYSEGLETLVETGIINDKTTLSHWLEQELRYGSIRVEAAIMLRGSFCYAQRDWQRLKYWNAWWSAARETAELRQQSWQMGRSLLKLLRDLQPEMEIIIDSPCNYNIAFGIAVSHWQIEPKMAILGYFQSWVTNFINAGVKLIPLGQTSGQQLLFNLRYLLIETTEIILTLEDDCLESCSWGLSLASMNHETQYTRLFRS